MAQAGDTGSRGPGLTMAEFLALSEDDRAARIDAAIEEMKAQNRRIRALISRKEPAE